MRQVTKKDGRMLVLVLVVLLGFGAACRGETPASNSTRTIMVRYINDGDTVSALVDGRFEKIRLIGIDAPEIGQAPWGEIAKRRLREMIDSSSREVSIECGVERRDKYGRLLAYLRTRSGRMVNREMLREGYAVIFTVPPNVKYVEKFVASERYARERKLGIWSGSGLKERPSDYRKQHPRFR
jgi:micrococcal nuclease